MLLLTRSQNFDFLVLKICIQVGFGELQLTQYYFNFERSYDVLKSMGLCILLNKNINFNKNETKSKMENPTQF